MCRDVKSNPLRPGGCSREDYMVTGGRGGCSKSGAGYKIVCMDWPKDKLVTSNKGEAGRNSEGWNTKEIWKMRKRQVLFRSTVPYSMMAGRFCLK